MELLGGGRHEEVDRGGGILARVRCHNGIMGEDVSSTVNCQWRTVALFEQTSSKKQQNLIQRKIMPPQVDFDEGELCYK